MAIIIPCRGQQNSFKTLGPIGSVLTFIKYNKTNKQTKNQEQNKPNVFLDLEQKKD